MVHCDFPEQADINGNAIEAEITITRSIILTIGYPHE